MARFIKDRSALSGTVPGSLVFIGEKKMEAASLSLFTYSENNYSETVIQKFDECPACRDTGTVSWININGLHDLELIESAGTYFKLHPLTLEDVLNTGQRPKMEEHDRYIFFTLKMMSYNEAEEMVESEQLSLILGNDFVLTFQERPGDVFETVRNRIRKNNGRIRRSGNDYLAYSLLDTIVENYIDIIERLGEKIENIEDEILEGKTGKTLTQINDYKREINYLRKSIRPVKEFIQQFARLDTNLIASGSRPFLKDLLDLSTQAVEIIDAYRDMLSDLLDIYNTLINNRLNEIMKVLTLFSTLFIPLTFVAGIYGTNFEYMPELSYRFAYFIFWAVLLLIAAAMFYFFKRKKWI